MKLLHRNVRPRQKHRKHNAQKPDHSEERRARADRVIIVRILKMFQQYKRQRQHHRASVHHNGDSTLQKLGGNHIGLLVHADLLENADLFFFKKIGNVAAVQNAVDVYFLKPFGDFRNGLRRGHSVKPQNRHRRVGVTADFKLFDAQRRRAQPASYQRQIDF